MFFTQKQLEKLKKAWVIQITPKSYQDHSKQKTQESTRIAEVQEMISEALAV